MPANKLVPSPQSREEREAAALRHEQKQKNEEDEGVGAEVGC